VVFASSLSIKNVVAVCKGLDYVKKIVIIDGEAIKYSKVTSLKNLVQENSKNDFNVLEHVKNPVNLAQQSSVIFLSSGTTGKPKGKFL
jgi:long-subunit acyl-CoA synthetase (AMP-forming)